MARLASLILVGGWFKTIQACRFHRLRAFLFFRICERARMLQNKKALAYAKACIVLSGWQDSNLRPPGPKPGAITGLRYIPNNKNICRVYWEHPYKKKIRSFCGELGFDPPRRNSLTILTLHIQKTCGEGGIRTHGTV